MNLRLHDLYNAFTAALASGDVVALSGMVDKANFSAILPGGPAEGMDFTLFVPEMERRRAPFSDFGQVVSQLRIVESSYQIAVYYSMTVTHDGELRAWGIDHVIPASGRQITLTCVDIVTFGAKGEVVELVTVSDRLPTLFAMGGGLNPQ